MKRFRLSHEPLGLTSGSVRGDGNGMANSNNSGDSDHIFHDRIAGLSQCRNPDRPWGGDWDLRAR
jgi:hypothetical protein